MTLPTICRDAKGEATSTGLPLTLCAGFNSSGSLPLAAKAPDSSRAWCSAYSFRPYDSPFRLPRGPEP
jgi:hypothetical protein